MSAIAADPTPGSPAATIGWTPAKVDKVIHLASRALELISEALSVPPNEVRALVLEGVRPSLEPVAGRDDAAPRAGGHAWAEERIDELRRLAPTMNRSELMARFRCSLHILRREAERAGVTLIMGRRQAAWSDAQTDELRTLAATKSEAELQGHFRIARSTLYRRAAEAGISLQAGPRLDVAALRRLAGSMPTRDVAAALGISLSALYKAAATHDIVLKVKPTVAAPPPKSRARAPRTPAAKETSQLGPAGWQETTIEGVVVRDVTPGSEPPTLAIAAPEASTPAPRRPAKAAPSATATYYLEAAPGLWLHATCELTTPQRIYRWQGTGRQLEAVWAKFPWTRKLKAVEVITP